MTSVGSLANLIEILQGVFDTFGDMAIYDIDNIATKLPDILHAGKKDGRYFIAIGSCIDDDKEDTTATKPKVSDRLLRMMESASGAGKAGNLPSGRSGHAGGGDDDEYI